MFVDGIYIFIPRCGIVIQFVTIAPLQWRHNGCDGISNTGVSIVCSNIWSGKEKNQSSASLAFVRTNPPVTGRFPSQSTSKARKMLPLDDVIMTQIHLQIHHHVNNICEFTTPWKLTWEARLSKCNIYQILRKPIYLLYQLIVSISHTDLSIAHFVWSPVQYHTSSIYLNLINTCHHFYVETK